MTDSVLSLQGLNHRYGDVAALSGVDLEIQPGEAVALLGPNGAGKSTTVSILLGLLDPDSGTATVCGKAPRAAVSAGLVGAMLQDAGLPVNATVGELVAMFGALYPQSIGTKEALAMAGAADLAGRKTDALSGGQAQRVRLALALVGDPTLLVLDEPTSAMDPEARRAFWTALRAQTADGRGVLFATHHLDEAQAIADRVVVLAGGRVVASGTPAEVARLGGQNLIRAALPDGVPAELLALPGVASTHLDPDGRTTLRCSDSDTALRALLAAYPDASRIEVRETALEDAFLALAEGGWQDGRPAAREAAAAIADTAARDAHRASTESRTANADLEPIR
ncbi:MAG: ABC transporter ATP-binding protein [Solirubrobacteraceae bacterium]|nr:ABC transporter ATP-binding protein [Solirubrobacteraceae bacterium]